MRIVSHFALAAGFLTVCAAVTWASTEVDTFEESSTGKRFPTTVSFEHDGTAYDLSATGATVRKKYFFKVYAIAHYMDTTTLPTVDDAVETAMSDDHAKQITMVFSRGVDAEKIQNAYRESFEKGAADAAGIAELVDRFVSYYGQPVEEDDVFVLRWLPGGLVLASVGGEWKAPIESVAFAKALWQIWLGEDSIIDPDKLFTRSVPGTSD